MRASIATVAFLAATVSAHGNVTSPPARLTGPAMVKACGQGAVNNVLQDGTIPLEDVFNTLPSCKLDLCRGAVFEDNKARVQKFSPGQVIPFKAQIPISHEGPANVSIVKTATNKILGDMLLVFSSYADEKLKVLPPNNTAFAVTIPTNLPASECTQAGDCVLQWFWFGTAAKQTYESCVDFIIVSGAGSGSSSSSSATSTSPSVSSGSSSSGSNTFSIIPTKSSTVVSSSTSTSISSSDASDAGSYGSPTSSSSSSSSTTSSSGSSEDGPDEASAPAEEASAPIPQPAEAVEGSFGGTAGEIPELNPDGTPAVSSPASSYGTAGSYDAVDATDSFGGTEGSIAAVTSRRRRSLGGMM